MRILAIGAHYDDLELGCGGTLARHVRDGDQVWGFIATESGYSDSGGKRIRGNDEACYEGRMAAGIIGYELISGDIPTFEIEPGERIQRKLLDIIESKKIDTIYTHWLYDVHHDHRNLAAATMHCAKHINRILMYRSNWYQSDISFREDFMVDISSTWVLKEKALRVYMGEMERTGNTWLDYFKRQAQNLGMQCGVGFAECFQVVKWMR